MKHHCHTCDQQATVFITFVKAGKVVSQSYCKTHAQSVGIFEPTSYALLQHLEPADRILAVNTVVCPKCGLSQLDFNHVGRLGCAECYHVFRDQILGIVSQIQVGMQHVGKLPWQKQDRGLLQNRLHNLHITLQDFIAQSRFEDAAHVRDEMNEITQVLNKTVMG